MHFESFVFLHYNLYWKVLSMKNNVVSLDFISTINTIQKYVHILIQNAQKYLDNEKLILENNILRTTRKGKFFCDGIASDLFYLNLEE